MGRVGQALLRLGLLGALSAGVWGAAPGALALDAGEKDPRKIMKAVEDREDGDKSTSRMTMTLKDKSGRQLKRTVQARGMDFEGGSKQIMFFESPADVRNTGLLSVDHDGDKDDDQWLFLPSLHKSTRISTSERSGSFMGTDITYSDMTRKNTDNYDYKMVEQSVKVGGEDCWLIEARPKTDKEKKETGYVKQHVWVSKSKMMPIQMKAWVKEGRKLKYMKFTDIKKVDGIWVAMKILVRVVKGGNVESETSMITESIRFNQGDVKDSDFSQRRLEKGI